MIGIGLSAGKMTIERPTPWGNEKCMTREEAEEFARKLAGQRVTDWMTSMNLATAFGILGRNDEAILWASRALMLKHNSSTLFNLAFAYETVGEFGKSFALVKEAVRVDPGNPFAGLLYAEGLLRRGNWQEGWPLYERYCWGDAWDELRGWRPEWRGPVPDGTGRGPVPDGTGRGPVPDGTGRGPVPDGTGRGEDIAGKRILILPPAQGCGDLIMFLRWCGELKKRGAYVIYTCSAMMETLFQGHEWIDRLIVIGNTAGSAETVILLEEFDCWACLMSLPWVFGSTPETIPWSGPYIKAPPPSADGYGALCRRIELKRDSKPLVGLCSQAGETNDPRRVRSLSASQTERLLALDGVEWVRLDYGRQPLIEDWSDTAALIDSLDLVISVDTGVMHLAGAMGKPTWVILPVRSDCKFFLERNDSPLYPSLRLFRSTREAGMNGAVQNVVEELKGIGKREEGTGVALHRTVQGVAFRSVPCPVPDGTGPCSPFPVP